MMRTATTLTTVALALAAPTSALAQQRDASVDSYLCEFAGKCGGTTSAETAPAPANVRTSETRGFRLARSTPAAEPAPPAAARRPGMVSRRGAAAAGAGHRVNLMLNFEHNSDQMTAAAQTKAKVFAQALLTPELRDKRFLIEGHTDARGSHDLNLDLSRRRARSVADFLIAQGVDARNVEVKGVGSDDPLPNQPATAEANRRVEAVLIS